MQFKDNVSVYDDTFTSAISTDVIDVRFVLSLFLVMSNTVAVSTAKTFIDDDVDVDENTITEVAHGWVTGRKVAATNGGGALPGGLSATDYYIIRVDADTFKLAANLVDALAGTPVNITSAAGGGTHTLTPAALSTASMKLQWSLDGVVWTDVAASSTNITATGVLTWTVTNPGYRYLKGLTAIAAGQVASEVNYSALKYR